MVRNWSKLAPILIQNSPAPAGVLDPQHAILEVLVTSHKFLLTSPLWGEVLTSPLWGRFRTGWGMILALEVSYSDTCWRRFGKTQGPRSRQDGPKTHPRRLQDASRRPKTPLKPPKTPQRRPQEAPRCLQEASRGLQEASRRLQEAPRCLQKVPRRLRDPRGTSKNIDFP